MQTMQLKSLFSKNKNIESNNETININYYEVIDNLKEITKDVKNLYFWNMIYSNKKNNFVLMEEGIGIRMALSFLFLLVTSIIIWEKNISSLAYLCSISITSLVIYYFTSKKNGFLGTKIKKVKNKMDNLNCLCNMDMFIKPLFNDIDEKFNHIKTKFINVNNNFSALELERKNAINELKVFFIENKENNILNIDIIINIEKLLEKIKNNDVQLLMLLKIENFNYDLKTRVMHG